MSSPALLAALLAPIFLIGLALCRGYAPYPLAAALLWRFRGANALFAVLIAVSVGISLGLLAQERGLRQGTAQAADKFDIVVAAPGSEFTILMAAVYLQPTDVPLLSGALYNEIAADRRVAIAAPLAFGDSHEGAPVVGTIPDFVTHLGRLEEGQSFTRVGEAVAGSAVALEIGATFAPTHGVGTDLGEVHEDVSIEIVGRLAPTGTPWDRAILVPVEDVWLTHGLPSGHSEEGRIGPPFEAELFPGTPAILISPKEHWQAYALRAAYARDGEAMAIFPGAVLGELYQIMGDVREAMSLLSLVTQGLVGLSVAAGLVILLRLFARQIAMLRAVGAPRRFVMAVIWLYGMALVVAGACLGMILGFAATWALSQVLTARTDIAIPTALELSDFQLVAAFLLIAAVLIFLPAHMAARRQIAEDLRR